MQRDILINKVLLNFREFGLNDRLALEYVYAVGFDEGRKYNHGSHNHNIRVYNKYGRLIGEYFTQKDCANALGIHRNQVYRYIMSRAKNRKGYTFELIK